MILRIMYGWYSFTRMHTVLYMQKLCESHYYWAGIDARRYTHALFDVLPGGVCMQSSTCWYTDRARERLNHWTKVVGTLFPTG